MAIKVGTFLLAHLSNFGRMPCLHHQQLIWVPAGVEPRFAGCKFVAVTTELYPTHYTRLSQRHQIQTSVACISGWAHLCSAECHDMLVPSTRTQPGRWSFHVAAPAVWNVLPSHLCSPSISRGQFRAGLKIHLFTQAYRHL